MQTSSRSWLLAAVAVGVVAVLQLAACGPAKAKCNPTTCATGCCDADGACQLGSLDIACGTGGNVCATCTLPQVCQLGFCVGNATGGGAGGGAMGGGTGGGATGGGTGGGGGGMTDCAATCMGCCDASGQCQAGTSTAACGTGGATCGTCAGSQTCTANRCVDTSCQGCVTGGGTCVAGTSAGTCGKGGVTCQTCQGGNTCDANGFCTGGVCGGCRDANQVCQSGTTKGACGTGGTACVACSGTDQCVGGVCTGGTGGGAGGGTGGGTGGGIGGGAGGGSGGGIGGGTGGGGSALSGDSCASPEALVFSGGTSVMTGTLAGYTNTVSPTCGAVSRPDHIYTFTSPTSQTADVTVEVNGSWRPAVALVEYASGSCGAEVTCNAATSNGGAAFFSASIGVGTYAVVVDSASGAGEGQYALTVTLSGGPPTGGGAGGGGGGGVGGGTGGGGTGTVTPLSNGVPVTISGGLQSETVFSVTVTGASSQLVVNLTMNTSGDDADLYERAGAIPDLTSSSGFDQSSENVGSDSITVAAPSAGTYYFTVYGYTAYTGATVSASW